MIDREENMWYTVDFAIPMDHHVQEKEEEKLNKYMDLALRLEDNLGSRQWLYQLFLEALGTLPAKLSESLEKLEIEDVIGSLQAAVLLSTTAILRRALNL